MTAAICQSTVTPFHVENSQSSPTPVSSWLPTHTPAGHSSSASVRQLDSWSKIQSQTPAAALPYIHPLVQRSRAFMSQTSLDMCTESLGSESGSNDFEHHWLSVSSAYVAENMTGQQDDLSEVVNGRRELLSSVNYHCTGKRSPTHSFPPPLPSISRRDGPCFRMRPHRCDGRLIVKAVTVPSRNYLRAHRREDHLVLLFIETAFSHQSSSTGIAFNVPQVLHQYKNHEPEDKNDKNDGEENSVEVEEADDEEDEEEEVEVVDRGMVVEVKVSTQPQQQKGAKKILRSSIMINKFVRGTPLINDNRWIEPPSLSHKRRMVPTTTSAAAAALMASSVSASLEVAGHSLAFTETKLLFTTKRSNWEVMLYNMRRCKELRGPLFFWEPCCIAAS